MNRIIVSYRFNDSPRVTQYDEMSIIEADAFVARGLAKGWMVPDSWEILSCSVIAGGGASQSLEDLAREAVRSNPGSIVRSCAQVRRFLTMQGTHLSLREIHDACNQAIIANWRDGK